MRISFLIIYLVAAITSLLFAARAATWPGRRKWIVVVIAAVMAAVNAWAVLAELV